MVDGHVVALHQRPTLFELNVETGAGEVGVEGAIKLHQDFVSEGTKQTRNE